MLIAARSIGALILAFAAPLSIPREILRGDLANVAIGALLFAVGAAGLAISRLQRKLKEPSIFYFGVFCTLYGVRELGNIGLVQASGDLAPIFWDYVDAFITYAIPLPALLFIEKYFGVGWHSSICWWRRLQTAYAIGAIAIDCFQGPHVAGGPNNYLVIVGFTLITANGLRSILQAESRLTGEIKLVLAGMVFLFGMVINTNLVSRNLVPWQFSAEPLGLLVFVVCLINAIAHRYFAKQRELAAIGYELRESALRAEAAEAQARAVESENRRRMQELEEARQLQLSMLPRSAPRVPHLEISAYMKTATEVGGDYYDFYLAEDGTLTVAIGDATGHGLKAGAVVTATKSLFEALAPQPEIPRFFQQASQALKRMNLRSMFMAMAMLKIDGSRLFISSAGMPSVLIYRAPSRTVEEISLPGMPLGSVHYAYKQHDTTLSSGDVVLLMSDGLPERFNPEGDMFGYARGGELLQEAAEQAPEAIVAHLVRASEAWADGRPLDDDLTLVVLKRI